MPYFSCVFETPTICVRRTSRRSVYNARNESIYEIVLFKKISKLKRLLCTLRAESYTSLSIGVPSSVYHESEKKYTGESDDKERKIHASAEG